MQAVWFLVVSPPYYGGSSHLGKPRSCIPSHTQPAIMIRQRPCHRHHRQHCNHRHMILYKLYKITIILQKTSLHLMPKHSNIKYAPKLSYFYISWNPIVRITRCQGKENGVHLYFLLIRALVWVKPTKQCGKCFDGNTVCARVLASEVFCRRLRYIGRGQVCAFICICVHVCNCVIVYV